MGQTEPLQLFPNSTGDLTQLTDARAQLTDARVNQAIVYSQLHLPEAQIWQGAPSQSFTSAEDFHSACFWFPTGLPNLSTTAVLSSRLSQKLESFSTWFDALRTLAVNAINQPSLFLSASDTTADRYLERTCELFELPFLRLKIAPRVPSQRWFETAGSEPNTGYCFLPTAQDKIDVNMMMGALAKRVVVLSVNKRGKTAQVLRQRLLNTSTSATHSTTTQLLVDHSLTRPKEITTWLDQGVSGWWLYRNKKQATSPTPPRGQGTPQNHLGTSPRRIANLNDFRWADYLIHCTRRRVGAWPQQSDSQYLDDLILQTARGRHDPLAALCRILATRTIYANNQLTRGSRPVASFADIPLNELQQHRTFRPHLSRWDFEPFGFAIRRDLFNQLGGEPVIYGDETTWTNLSPERQPYFQLAESVTKSGVTSMHWTQEKEWRFLGDFNLDWVPENAGVVFVSSQKKPQWLLELSNWPIVRLNFQ